MCPSNRPCQALWVNPASSRNLRLILLVSQSQSVSGLNLRGFHYASFRLSDLLRSQYGILNLFRCQQVWFYVHMIIYVLLGIYPIFTQLLFPMLKFFSQQMKCKEINIYTYIYKPYINTLFSNRVYKWPSGKQPPWAHITVMSCHGPGIEFCTTLCEYDRYVFSECLICGSVSSAFVWWIRSLWWLTAGPVVIGPS